MILLYPMESLDLSSKHLSLSLRRKGAPHYRRKQIKEPKKRDTVSKLSPQVTWGLLTSNLRYFGRQNGSICHRHFSRLMPGDLSCIRFFFFILVRFFWMSCMSEGSFTPCHSGWISSRWLAPILVLILC